MTKPISTRTHGIIDYTMAAAFFALPRMMHWGPEPSRLADAAGALSTGYAAITDYELGAARLLPMEGHLAIDAVECSALTAAPWILGERDRQAAWILAAMGAAGLVISALTQTEPGDRADYEDIDLLVGQPSAAPNAGFAEGTVDVSITRYQ